MSLPLNPYTQNDNKVASFYRHSLKLPQMQAPGTIQDFCSLFFSLPSKASKESKKVISYNIKRKMKGALQCNDIGGATYQFSWFLSSVSWFLASCLDSLLNLELQEVQNICSLFSTCCWKLLKQAKNYNVNLSIIFLGFLSPELSLYFLFTVLFTVSSPAGHLVACQSLTYALCSSCSHFDPCISP